MKVCLLQSAYPPGSPFYGVDPPKELRLEWLPTGSTIDNVMLTKQNVLEEISKRTKMGYDMFVDLCDGVLDDPDLVGPEVPRELEKNGAVYTGANEAFFIITREEMKTAAVRSGVPTARYLFAYNESDLTPAKNFTFPLIVKHWNGPGGSVGISNKSRVNNFQELLTQGLAMIEQYKGCLVEEFVEGREFTVLVLENPDDEAHPFVYKPIECVFDDESPGFKTFDIKWKDYRLMKWVPCSEPDLEQKLKDYSATLFKATKANSYGRLDWRVRKNGEPVFLEINSQPAILYPFGESAEPGSGDYILNSDPGGHKRFIEMILKSAFKYKENGYKIIYPAVDGTPDKSPNKKRKIDQI